MKTLEKKIINLSEIKEQIRKAIVSKGVPVPEGASFSEFPAKILEIETIKTKKRKEKANDR